MRSLVKWSLDLCLKYTPYFPLDEASCAGKALLPKDECLWLICGFFIRRTLQAERNLLHYYLHVGPGSEHPSDRWEVTEMVTLLLGYKVLPISPEDDSTLMHALAQHNVSELAGVVSLLLRAGVDKNAKRKVWQCEQRFGRSSDRHACVSMPPDNLITSCARSTGRQERPSHCMCPSRHGLLQRRYFG